MKSKTSLPGSNSKIPIENISMIVASVLLDIKAVTLSPNKPYTWASGIKSPIYCDNRLLISYPDKRTVIRDAFIETIKENDIEFDIIAGTSTSGIPHAAWLADKLNKPMIYVKKKAKDYGQQKLIEGVLEKGQKVLIIEDLISTGGSSLAVVEAVRDAGGIVTHCLAIFTYQLDKATAKFKDADCTALTLSNFSTLVKQAERLKYITEQEKNTVLEWSTMPDDWAKKYDLE